MNDTRKVAVVTGGNRGIGLQICKILGEQGVHVILGSRDEASGRAAAAELAAAGHAVEARALDVTREETIEALAAWIVDAFGGLDIVVNNAGLAMDGFNAEIAKKTLEVNFFGVLRVTDRFLPHVRRGGRVVNVTSGLGDTSELPSPLRTRLHAADLARDELERLMRGFLDGVAAGTHAKDGWPSSAYRVSKMGLNAYTALLGRTLLNDARAIRAHAACPGWVKTRMGGASAPRTVEEGADTPAWLALRPEGGEVGVVFRDRRRVSW